MLKIIKLKKSSMVLFHFHSRRKHYFNWKNGTIHNILLTRWIRLVFGGFESVFWLKHNSVIFFFVSENVLWWVALQVKLFDYGSIIIPDKYATKAERSMSSVKIYESAFVEVSGQGLLHHFAISNNCDIN